MISPDGRPATRPPTRAARRLIVGLAILAVYLAAYAGMPRGAFYSPDSGGKFLQLLGYRWDGGLRLDVPYPGKICDPKGYFYGHSAETGTSLYPSLDQRGRIQAGWPPWFPLLIRPFYRAFGFVGIHLLPWLAGLTVIALGALLAERLRPGSGPFAAGVVGLTSPLLFYSLCFWEHTLAIAFGLGAILLVPNRDASSGVAIRPIRWLGVAGLLLLAGVLRPELVFFSTVLAVTCAFLLPQQRRGATLIACALTAGAAIVIILLPDHADWFTLLLPDHAPDAARRLLAVFSPEFLQQVPQHVVRTLLMTKKAELLPRPVWWLATLGLTLCLGSVIARGRRVTTLAVGAMLLSLPALLLAFMGTRYRVFNSVLLPVPLVVLALLPTGASAPASTFRRLLGWTGFFFVAAFLLVLPALGIEDGGQEWGSRYTLIAIVILLVLAAVTVAEIRADSRLPVWVRRTVGVLALWLILLGALSTARGINELWLTRRELLAVQAVLEQTGEPVVTNLWWLGASLAPFASRHEVYLVAGAHPLREWLTVVGPVRPRFSYVVVQPTMEVRDTATLAEMGVKQVNRRDQDGLLITRCRLEQPP